MKHIPVIFPMQLALITPATSFTGAYAIAEEAVNGDGTVSGGRLDPDGAGLHTAVR